jgi:hypothetical protein
LPIASEIALAFGISEPLQAKFDAQNPKKGK